MCPLLCHIHRCSWFLGITKGGNHQPWIQEVVPDIHTFTAVRQSLSHDNNPKKILSKSFFSSFSSPVLFLTHPSTHIPCNRQRFAGDTNFHKEKRIMTPSRDKNERPIIEMESKIPLDCPILVPKSTFIEGNIPRPQKFAYMLSWAIEIWGENLMTVTVDGESSTVSLLSTVVR